MTAKADGLQVVTSPADGCFTIAGSGTDKCILLYDEGDAEVVQTVIDARVRQGPPMIVTTNLSAEALKNPADVRSQRVCSRLIGACFPYEVKGPDRRKESLKKSFADLKAALLEQ